MKPWLGGREVVRSFGENSSSTNRPHTTAYLRLQDAIRLDNASPMAQRDSVFNEPAARPCGQRMAALGGPRKA
jgi:hypothetical protein